MMGVTALRMMGAALTLALGAGCTPDATPDADGRSMPDAAAVEPRSIFRPEFQVADPAEPEGLAPLDLSIAFPQGAELSEAALAELGGVLKSPEMAGNGAIVIRGHSDAGGSDAVNKRVSLARAVAVRDWLVAKGVDAKRMTVIGFGEQNPVAPNALPDGTPNEAGRARNRRVDLHIETGAKAKEPEGPTLAETLAEPAPDGSVGEP